MTLHEHILPDYDVKLVGTKAEVIRFRTDVAAMRTAIGYLYRGRSDLPNWAAATIEAVLDAPRTTSDPPKP